ncbi:sialidase family protein [Staphylococcus delphini]|uniref:sialidase family protein n=1 Tax=Staphylococcus delphini TaxID=53344 RepID=UPI000BBC4DD2|nr:exo-alpha-sialidase [Staphylococcus delphini]PCF37947.1 sialidase [Staphylococcus delphini]
MKSKHFLAVFKFLLVASVILSLFLFHMQTVNAGTSKKHDKGERHLIDSEKNLHLTGEGADITKKLKGKIENKDFTIWIQFKQDEHKGNQALIGASNSKSQNSYFDVFVRENGELGAEVRNESTQTNHLISRPASVWGKFKSKPVSNTVAIVGNARQQTYTLYANGTKVVEQKVDDYKKLGDIEGLDAFVIGGVKRSGKVDFGFKGTIENMQIYDTALNENTMINKTTNDVTQKFIFRANDATLSNYFRIPVLNTLSNGRVLASADARYAGTHDFTNKINTALSYSDDNGQTWSKPQLPLAFEDFAAEPLDWPRDPEKSKIQLSGGATYIDPMILEKSDHQVLLLADVLPARVSSAGAKRDDSGFKKVNGHYYMKLQKQGESAYNYTIRDKGVVYDERTNKPTQYSVDDDFSIKQNGQPLKTDQLAVKFENGEKVEYKNGKKVNMTIFYKDALFKVVPTNFIAYTSSNDHGTHWSKPKLIPPVLGENRNTPFLGPGRGMVESQKGRILIPSYTGKEFVSIYSDDNGKTWHSKVVPLPSNWSAEAQIVEIKPGVLQAYMRTNNGKIAYMTSIDSGDHWSSPQYLDFVSNPNYGTELSIIKYSHKIDGKDAVILSTPNSKGGRRNGQIWIGLVNDDNSIDWRYHHDVDYAEYGYSYSSLTELPDGKIGLMFEKFESWSNLQLHLKNVLPYVIYDIDDLKENQQ